MSTSTQPMFKARLNYALPFSPEIRNQIYHYVLTNPGHIPLEPSEEKDSKSFSDSDERKWAEEGAGPDPRPLQLLLLSRQTYTEAYHIYYRENTLHFDSFMRFSLFLKNTGEARRREVTGLSFNYSKDDDLSYYQLTIWQLPNLKSLEIILKHSSSPDSSLVTFLSEVHGLESARINRTLATRLINGLPPRLLVETEPYWQALEPSMLQPQLRAPSDDGSFQGEIDERLQQHSSIPPGSEPFPNDMDKVVELSKPDETTTGKRDAQNLRREVQRVCRVSFSSKEEYESMDSDPAKVEEFVALMDFAQGEYMIVAYGR